jgi:exopolysaccharide production protein ExoY
MSFPRITAVVAAVVALLTFLRDPNNTTLELNDPAIVEASLPSSFERAGKRALDLSIAVPALLLTAPLMIVAAATIKATSPGPAVFRQRRVGRRGQTFECFKFRSMHHDAETRLRELMATDTEFRTEWLADQKVRKDPRITKVGAWLRRSSLDELPQLFNVIKGDMSIVGPRPIVPNEAVRYGDALPTVLRMKPGITGPWQVSGRNNLSYSERVALDTDYVQRFSMSNDIGIGLRTVRAVASTRGAS